MGFRPSRQGGGIQGRVREVVMEFQDKTLNCVDCGTPFVWTAGEQLFFADKNFKNEPKRCKSCKAKRAARPAGGGGVGREGGVNKLG